MCMEDITRRAICQTDEFLEMLSKKHKLPKKESDKWQPPDEGILNFNSDAAYTPGEV